jgi:hypothetical protein
MNQMLVVNAHSFIDVITNSSTELFVCNTDKTLSQISDILKELLSDWNRQNKFNWAYRDVFQDPVVVTKNNIEKIENDCCYGFDDKYTPRRNYLMGNIVIYGVDDNSIPYDLFDEIEQVFNANRYHLG